MTRRKSQNLLRKITHNSSIPWQRTIGASGGKTVDKLMQEFESELRSVALAFQTNVGLSSTPSCLVGSHLFQAQTKQSFPINLPYMPPVVGGSQDPPYNIPNTVGGTVLANYVIRDANTYQIPIRNNAAGAFCVKYIRVYISQRIFSSEAGRAQYQMVPTNYTSGLASSFKYAIWNMYAVTGGFNYFWNIEDAKSGRTLGDDLMPHLVMTPRTNPYIAATSGGALPVDGQLNNAATFDGDFFELEVPWILERDGQINFHFRPITPLLQFDSSVPDFTGSTSNTYIPFTTFSVGTPPTSLEQGIRRQDATVYIELHGHKINSDQDLAKMGALTHSTDME